MKIIKTSPGCHLFLGHKGEKLALQIVFDIGSWLETYGPGTAHLLHQRKGDSEPYPVGTVQEGDQVFWNVSDSDTAVEGAGHYELHFYTGESLVKSVTGDTLVTASLAYGTEPPEPVQLWLDHVAEEEHKIYQAVTDTKAANAEAKNAAALSVAAQMGAETAQRGAEKSAEEVKSQVSVALRAAQAAEVAADEAVAKTHQALEDAKSSGAFDGKNGQNYILTDADKKEIAEQAAEMVEVPEPEGTGIEVTAKPGQLIRVKEVDENGNPTKWENFPYLWVEKKMVEILPETTFTEENMVEVFAALPPLGLVLGDTYIVKMNGTEIPIVAGVQDMGGTVPAVSLIDPNGMWVIVDLPTELAAQHGFNVIMEGDLDFPTTIAIYHNSETIHKLPGKFLPGGVPYVEKSMVEILAETTIPLEGVEGILPDVLPLVVGQTYVVTWDGEEYTYVAQDFSVLIPGAVGLGSDQTGKGIIVAAPGIGTVVSVNGDEKAETTISIYQGDIIHHPISGELLPEGVPYVYKDYILEETDAVEGTDPTFGKSWTIAKAPILTIGETYTVIYNGVAYDCVCYSGDDSGLSFAKGGFLMGNFSVVGGANTGEPFAMVILPSYQTIINLDLTGATSVRIGIMGKVGHKVDELCLPDGIARVFTVKAVTGSSTTDGYYEVSIDKTFDEIKAQAKNGSTIVRALIVGDDGSVDILPLQYCWGDVATFSMTAMQSIGSRLTQTIWVKPDNTALLCIEI